MKNRWNISIFIAILILLTTLGFLAARAEAGNLQAVEQSAKFGGKFYAVKVFSHTTDSTYYYLVGNEAGFQIYNCGATPVFQDDYPAPATAYTGGNGGLGISNFRTSVDAMEISSTEYAFYADGKYLYALNIHIPTAITEADSVAITNVRAVRVATINSHSFAFALAYQSGAPGTTMLYVIDIDDPTAMTIIGTLDLDTDDDNPNNTGACAIEYVADLDNVGATHDPYLFIADGTEGIKAVDISILYTSATTMPTINDITYTETGGTAQGLDVVRINDILYAFVADGSQGLKVFNVTNPTDMPEDDDERYGSLVFSGGKAYDVKLFGTTAFVANGEDGVRLVDVADPNSPVEVTKGENSAGAALSYIDSTTLYNRLNGTAYSLDFCFETPTGTNPQLITVVAWGEAGLMATDLNLSTLPGIGQSADLTASSPFLSAVSDGTNLWVLHSTGKVSKITPGGNLSTAAGITTTTAAIFHTSGNIVYANGYIYGIANGATTKIRRFPTATFAAAPVGVETSSDTATDYGTAGGVDIYKLFTDGTNVFFLDKDRAVAPANQDECELGRVNTTAFAAGGDLIESGPVFPDVGVCPNVVSDGTYVYGMECTVATGTLTITGVSADGDQIRVGDDYYELDNTGLPLAHADSTVQVTVAAFDVDTILAALEDAINDDGTEPATAVADLVADTLTVTVLGKYGNSIITTVPFGANKAWGAGTLLGGGAANGHISRIPVGFAEGDLADDTTATALSGNLVDIVTDSTRTYIVASGADGNIGKLTGTFGTGTDVLVTTNTPFFASATSSPLLILDDYIYGLTSGDNSRLSRVALSYAVAAPTKTPSIADTPATITMIRASDDYIYAKGANGNVTKFIPSLFGTAPGDAISTATAELDAATDIIATNNYIYGSATTAALTYHVRMIGLVGDEDDHKISLRSAGGDDHFAGYARDVDIYLNTGVAGADYAYVADGEKGIVRFTVTNPTLSTSWANEVLTDATAAADGDVTDDEDIQDARGIDVTADNTLVLVADGTKGVKTVLPAATGLDYDDDAAGVIGPANGYITQSGMSTTNGAAEDIQYFTFDNSIEVNHEYAAVANGLEGVVILDLSKDDDAKLGDMEVMATVDTSGYAYGVAIDKSNYDTDTATYSARYIYLADGSNGLVIIDLDPNDTTNDLTDAGLLGGNTHAYTAGSSYNLRSVVLDDPNDPSYAFLAYGSKGVIILDISDPTTPTVADTYPSSGIVDGEAYDLAYDSSTGSLYVAMSYGAILALDVNEPDSITLKDSLNTYGSAYGIAYGDVDADVTPSTYYPHLFIANGPGGFLTASIKPQPDVLTAIPNIQPVEGGDTIRVIGSGFIGDGDDVGTDNDMTLTLTDGTDSTSVSYTFVSAFEITFTAPVSPSGLPGEFDLQISRGGVPDTLSDAIEYVAEGKAIIEMSADETGQGIASPGGDVPLNLILHENGAGQVTSVTARIQYNITQFEVATDTGGSVQDSVFDLNDDLEKDVEMVILDTNTSDNYKVLSISILSQDTGVNTIIPDGTTLGTVYLTVKSTNATDITLSIDSSDSIGVSQQVATSLGDWVEAYGSEVDIYVKPAPVMTASFTGQTSLAAGYPEATDKFGPIEVTVTEALDTGTEIANAEVTFTISSANAMIDEDEADDLVDFTIETGKGTLSSTTATSITVLTNATGEADISFDVGTKAGSYTVSISGEYNGSPITGSPTTPITESFTITAESTPDDPNDSVSLSYTPSSPTTGGNVTVTATAYDRYENPLSGRTITFSTDSGSLSALSATTNTSGQASVTLTLENAMSAHTVTATYDGSTTDSMAITPSGPDVNGDGSWSAASDVQAAINYHIEWTDLTTVLSSGQTHLPGDTNENDHLDLNEVIAIINLALGI